MEGFTIVDGGVAAVIVISAILAHARGLVREAMAILGWIAAAAAAFAFAPLVRPLASEIPVISGYISGSCELQIVVAFALVFAVALVVVAIFTPILSGMIRDTALGPVDRVLGFLFGALRGVLLVAVAMILYDAISGAQPIPSVEASRTANIYARSKDNIEAALPDDAPGWILTRYEGLIGACEA